MKLLTIILSAALTLPFSPQVFAGGDSTPTLEQATKLAFLFASDNVFSELLDHDSSVEAVLIGEDDNGYNFSVLYRRTRDGGIACQVKVRVSKELGMATQESKAICN
jgi:hypothetical protein